MTSPSSRQPAREYLETPLISPLEQKLNILESSKPSTKPTIGAVPRSSVFDRLQAFLPSIAAANEALTQNPEDHSTLDIEHVEEDYDGPVIEMDLACGVLDLKDQAAVEAAEREMARGHAVQLQGSCSDASSSDDSDDSNDDSVLDDEDDEMMVLGDMMRSQAAGVSYASSGGGAGAGGDEGLQPSTGQDEQMGDEASPEAGATGGRRKVKAKRNSKALIQEMS